MHTTVWRLTLSVVVQFCLGYHTSHSAEGIFVLGYGLRNWRWYLPSHGTMTETTWTTSSFDLSSLVYYTAFYGAADTTIFPDKEGIFMDSSEVRRQRCVREKN